VCNDFRARDIEESHTKPVKQFCSNFYYMLLISKPQNVLPKKGSAFKEVE